MRGTIKRRALLLLAALALTFAVATPVFAQSGYPNKPSRIIVPFGPGGSSDVIARILSIRLQQVLGQGVVVENRAGAGSNIGTAAAARAGQRRSRRASRAKCRSTATSSRQRSSRSNRLRSG